MAVLAALLGTAFPLMADNRPQGLMTDLIEHTDRTWNNGYASGLAVWEVEQAIEPLQYAAIRSSRPVFSWIVPGEQRNTIQTGYRLIVADSHADALAARGNVWDSGEVNSSRSVAVPYGGVPLQPSRTYFWRVKTRTNTEGESAWSEVKAFRTADSLADYAVSCYPLVKTMELPAETTQLSAGVHLVDFGKDAFAQPVLTLASASSSDTVTIHLGERLEQGRVARRAGGSSIRYRCIRLALQKGTHTYRIKIPKDGRNTGKNAVLLPAYVGEVLPFRYCEIEGYRCQLTPGAVFRETVHYPFDTTASRFVSSDTVLNQVWELCKYSIRATSFSGIYVDGDRERIPYEADALINQLCHYATDREYTMARRTYEYLLQHPTWPTEWILQAVLIAWNDYLYTGDSRSLESTYELLRPRVLLVLREKNGLISTTTGLQTPDFLASIRMESPIKDIVDWPHTKPGSTLWNVQGESDGFVFTDYNAVTNAFHYEALRLMGQIAHALGKADDEDFYTAEAEAFKRLFACSFFDKSKKCFRDGLSADTEHASLHANMLPLAFGMVPGKYKPQVLDFVRSRGMACSVYGAQFLMDALYEAGDGDYALQMLTKTDDRSWYNMIRAGSTISTEAWDTKYKTNQDWNHAWGAVPANIIPRKLMGVEPLTPGFGTIRIRPMTGGLEQAEADIPTVRGTVSVSITNRNGKYVLKASIPANMQAEVYLPLLSGKSKALLDGVLVKFSRVKNAPFVYAGKVGSGTYTWELVY